MPDPEPPGRRHPVPTAVKVAAATIAIGLLLDISAHTVGAGGGGAGGSAPLGEHLAHLVVLIGMVLVLAAIVRDGYRTPRRTSRREGSASRAVR